MEKYIKRLTQEWQLHGKVIIAVDFDDTISPWKFNSDEDKDFYKELISLLKECKNVGAYIVVFTACSPDRYEEIKSYCKKSGLEIDDINNVPINLPYGNGRKLYANIFVDDRAGINEAIEILRESMYLTRAYKHSIKPVSDLG